MISKLKIIFENDDFLILDKPAGLLVHPTKYQKENTLVDFLLEKYPEIKNVGQGDRPGIVHRLDRDVSGLMVIAKNQKTYEHLVKQFQQKAQINADGTLASSPTQLRSREARRASRSGQINADNISVNPRSPRLRVSVAGNNRRESAYKPSEGEAYVKKGYLALVYNVPPQEAGTIDLPIGRTKKGKLVAVRSHKKIKFEKPALTKYKILRRFKGYTYLEIEPLTGRTHQIRLHLKSIGCPIVGDKRYAKIKNKKPKIKNDLDRVFLHACYLGFYDLNDVWQEFKQDLPKELKSFVQNLEFLR